MNKNIKNLQSYFIFTAAAILLTAGLFSYNQHEAQAYTVNGNASLGSCDKKDTSGRCGDYIVEVPDSGNVQMFEGGFSGHAEGHGSFGPSGGKVGMTLCMSSSPSMWTGSCWEVVNPSNTGNIGDNHADFNIGPSSNCCNFDSDYNYPGRYLIAEGYANDATWTNMSVFTVGRKLEVTRLDANGSDDLNVQACQPFGVSWRTDWANRAELSYSGALGSSTSDVPTSYDNDTYSTCNVGVTQFRLTAWGPSASGYTSTYRTINVNTFAGPVPPPPPPGPGPGPNPPPPVGPTPPPPPITPDPIPPPVVTPPSVTCTDNASIESVSSTPATVSPGQVFNVTIRVRDTGDTRWYNGTGYKFIQRSGLTIVSTYGNLDYGHLPAGAYPNDYIDWTFAVTAPASAGNYNLQLQMRHSQGWYYIKPNNDSCTAPGTDVFFGGTTSIPFTVTASLPPYVLIDNPAPSATISGTTRIEGWALDNLAQSESAIVSVQIDVDGIVIASNRVHTVPRGDVCAIYPRPDCPNVGYFYDWNTLGFSNGTHTIHITATDAQSQVTTITRQIIVQNLGNIVVNSVGSSGAPFGGGWTISGPSGWSSAASVPSTTASYPNRPAGTYTLTPATIPNYTFSISPASPQTISAGASLSWTIVYTQQTGNVSARANIASGVWYVRNNVGTPVAGNVGTAPVNFALPAGNYTFEAADLASYIESVQVNGGTPSVPTPYSFTVSNNSSIVLVALYDQPMPAAPTDIRLENSPCNQMSVSWQDNANNESGFRLYYRTSASGPDVQWAEVGPVAGTGGRGTATWATPPAQPVWISIASFITYGASRAYSPVFVSPVSFTAQTCYQDLSSSKKEIVALNGGAYTSSMAIKNDDVVTFRITIQNNGTDRVSLNDIFDTRHPNPTNDSGRPLALFKPTGAAGWNLRVDKNADGDFTDPGESATIVGTQPNMSISVSGVKCTTSNNTGCSSAVDPSCVLSPVPYCNNWVVLFDALVSSPTPEFRSEVWNEANLDFTYNSVAGSRTLLSPRYLINTGGPKVPNFHEISP